MFPYFAGGCPSASWRNFGSFCYLVNSALINWERANVYCKSKGGQLARITGARLEKFLLQTYRNNQSMNIWIGLTKCEKGAWCFPDGKPSSYYNWETGEPNNAGGKEYCVVMLKNGRWYDQACHIKRPSICEIRTS